jgi:hypothetical protein
VFGNYRRGAPGLVADDDAQSRSGLQVYRVRTNRARRYHAQSRQAGKFGLGPPHRASRIENNVGLGDPGELVFVTGWPVGVNDNLAFVSQSCQVWRRLQLRREVSGGNKSQVSNRGLLVSK